MLDPALTDADVSAVLAAMAAENAEVGDLATQVWMSLTAGEGPARVSLAGLQTWAWWLLPKRSYGSAHDRWTAEVDAAAQLFDRLGSPSYAAVCRSAVTEKVLAAWAVSRSKGMAATRKALTASAVEPPDLEDFEWGQTFGVWESQARSAVEVALERAVDDGRLDPNRRGWRHVAAAVCAETLDGEAEPGIEQTWRTLVSTERAESWANGAGTPHVEREDRHAIAVRFLAAPPPPPAEVIAGPLNLLGWFAETCGDGVTLTTSGYLPRDLVVEAVEAHGWRDWDKPPRSEADVWQLRLVHAAARRLGVVARRGRRLATTKAGGTVADDPGRWWPRLVLLGQGRIDYRDALFEAVALALAVGRTHEVDDLRDRVGARLAAQGWQTEGRRLTAEDHSRRIYEAINPWRCWGFVDYQEGRWARGDAGPTRVEPTTATATATPAGLAAADLWLHRRITGPRNAS